MKNKFICLLLLITIIFTGVLIYKIETTPEYLPEIYEQVYKEYEQIITANSSQELDNDLTSSSSNNTLVLNQTATTPYRTIGVIEIPKIDISYPIINECTESNLNIAPTKLIGPAPHSVGNLVLIAHNNWNKDFFSNLHKLEKDDIVELIDASGKKLTYKVYDSYQIKQDDLSCLEQNTNGKIELTLITCVKYQKSKRLVVKCIANS